MNTCFCDQRSLHAKTGMRLTGCHPLVFGTGQRTETKPWPVRRKFVGICACGWRVSKAYS